MSDLPTLAARIDYAMKQRGLTQQQLAEAAGTSQTTIQKLCSGKTRESKKLNAIAKALQMSAEWLATGEPPAAPQLPTTAAVIPSDEAATVLGKAGRKLPVIGSIAAGAWCEAVALQPDAVEEWIESPGPVGPRAFVLKIDGISMYNPGGTISFADGDQVVIDPDVEPLPGDFVVARLTNSNRVTFKRLRQDEGECYLEAINPAWEPRYIRITEDWHICGKAKWKVQRL